MGVGHERVGARLDVSRNSQVSADDRASAVDLSEDSLELDALGGSKDNVDGGVLASGAQVGAVARPGDVLGLASSPNGALGGGAIWFKDKTKVQVSNLNHPRRTVETQNPGTNKYLNWTDWALATAATAATATAVVNFMLRYVCVRVRDGAEVSVRE